MRPSGTEPATSPLYAHYPGFPGEHTEAQRGEAPLSQWAVEPEATPGCFCSLQLNHETSLNDLLRDPDLKKSWYLFEFWPLRVQMEHRMIF